MFSGYRTPLGRARGLGSAKHGVSHWISERVSSIALVPLTLWVCFGVIRLAAGDYDFAVAWISIPEVSCRDFMPWLSTTGTGV